MEQFSFGLCFLDFAFTRPTFYDSGSRQLHSIPIFFFEVYGYYTSQKTAVKIRLLISGSYVKSTGKNLVCEFLYLALTDYYLLIYPLYLGLFNIPFTKLLNTKRI